MIAFVHFACLRLCYGTDNSLAFPVFSPFLCCKVDMWSFHVISVASLGYIFERGQVLTDPAKIPAVAEGPKPASLKQLQWFLEFAHFCCCCYFFRDCI